MKKVAVLALVLLLGLVGMSAAADTIIDPRTTGQWAVLFSNGYTGFCMDLSKDGTTLEDDFTEGGASIAVSNYYENEQIADYLKLAFVFDHLSLFPCRLNGGYYDAQMDNQWSISHLVWLFSDYSYKAVREGMTRDEFYQSVVTNSSKDPIVYKEDLCRIVVDAIDRYNQGYRVSDDGIITYPDGTTVSKYLFDEARNTSVRMSFKYMDSLTETTQDFFAYKITYFREVEVTEGKTAKLDAAVNEYKTQSNTWTGMELSEGSFDESGLKRTYTTHPVSMSDHGREYRCVFVDKEGTNNLTSHYQIEYVFTLKVVGATEAPQVDWYPAPPASVEAGKALTLCVDPQNADELMWYVDKGNGYAEVTDADGTVSSDGKSLTIQEVTSSQNGYKFKCVASNSTGSKETSAYTLNVVGLPEQELEISWVRKPEGSVKNGETATLEVACEGAESLQWYVNDGNGDQPIVGETDAVLIITAVAGESGNDGYTYCCVATSGNQSVTTSPKFTLKVCDPPVITFPQKDDTYTVADSDMVKLYVSATGSNLIYQWSVKVPGEASYTDIENADSAEYEVGSVTTADNGNMYRCTVSNSCGSATRDFTLNVVAVKDGQSPVVISPKNEETAVYFAGESVTLTVVAEHAAVYQWYVDKGDGMPVIIEGAVEPELIIETAVAAQDGWQYICVVRNEFGEAGSPAFVLKLASVPQMPQTGDDSDILVWIGLMLFAVACSAFLKCKKSALR